MLSGWTYDSNGLRYYRGSCCLAIRFLQGSTLCVTVRDWMGNVLRPQGQQVARALAFRKPLALSFVVPWEGMVFIGFRRLNLPQYRNFRLAKPKKGGCHCSIFGFRMRCHPLDLDT
jgi:hypothetical protein